jgi:glycosyltransferase involved in cell wall biosynthesis
MKPQSVLLVTPRWARNGGVAAHVQASAGELARRGMRVAVLAARVESENAIAGVKVFAGPALFDTAASTAARLGEALSFAPEVIHLHQVDDPALVGQLRASAPVLISAHGYIACTSRVHYFRPGQECNRAHGPGCVPNLLVRGCAHTRRPQKLPAAYERASRALATLTAADLAISYSSAIDRHLATNGIVRRRVIPLFATTAAASGSGHHTRRRVVFAGRVVTPKGVGVLIRAARSVEGEFVICGDGWRLAAMRRLAARLGVADRVHFKGWLGPAEIAQELAEASVVAVPSVWPEPFGLVGIEAMASGRPVVASATGGIEDWLQDTVNGLAVSPGDPEELAGALQELLSDPARQEAMGAAGRRIVAERFSPEVHVAALRDAYADARSAWEGEPEASSRGGRSGAQLI